VIEKPTAVNEEIVNILRLSGSTFPDRHDRSGDFARLLLAVWTSGGGSFSHLRTRWFYEAVQEILASGPRPEAVRTPGAPRGAPSRTPVKSCACRRSGTRRALEAFSSDGMR
jgi:hypothetical protein